MSEQYIVSARKYRPQTFDTVVGQKHITTTLKNAIKNNQLAHAYLFCGPRGVGKTSCARILAKTINCENPTPAMEACNTCSTCLSFQENTSLNIFELDAASNNSVDDIRRLTEQVRYAPQHGKYKIYIIDEVHMLSQSAFNAFLKTLEEPPSYAIFILATTEKHKILPTILSRCQIFDFKRIQTPDIVEHMASIASQEGILSEEAGLHIIAQKSEGCMRDALSMLDRIAGFSEGKLTYANVVEHLNILDAETYFQLSDKILAQDLSGSLLLLDDILQKGFDGAVILNGFQEHFRNLLLCKEGRMARLLDLPEAHKRTYFEYAQMIAQPIILSAMSLLNDAELSYRNALNKRMHLELAIIRLCYLKDIVLPGEMMTSSSEKKNVLKESQSKVENASLNNRTAAAPAASATSVAPTTQHGGTTKSNAEMPSPPVTPPVNTAPPAFKRTVLGEIPPAQNTANPQSNIVSEKEVNEPKGATNHLPPPMPSFAEKKSTKNLLEEIKASVIKESSEKKAVHLDEALLLEIFKDYKINLRLTPHELPALAQLELTVIQLISQEEARLLCNSEMNHAYAQNKSADLRDFISERTGIKNFKLTVVIDEKMVTEAPKIDRPLSKLEAYEKMSEENIYLKQLKEQLGMNID